MSPNVKADAIMKMLSFIRWVVTANKPSESCGQATNVQLPRDCFDSFSATSRSVYYLFIRQMLKALILPLHLVCDLNVRLNPRFQSSPFSTVLILLRIISDRINLAYFTTYPLPIGHISSYRPLQDKIKVN